MIGRLKRAFRELMLSDYDAGLREIERRFTAGYMTANEFASLQKRGDAAFKRLDKKFKKEER